MLDLRKLFRATLYVPSESAEIGVCSIRSKNCSEDSAAVNPQAKSSSAGLSVQFMSPGGNKTATTDVTDDTVTSQRIANYAVASASAGTSAAAKKDKDAKDIL